VRDENKKKDFAGPIGWGIVISLLAVAAVAFFGTGGGFRRIEAGEVGIRFDAADGSQAAVLSPRLEFYWPTQRLITYPSSLLTTSFVRGRRDGDGPERDDSILSATASGTSMNLDISVSWRVESDDLNKVFANFGEAEADEIADRYLRPLTASAANLVTGRLAVDDILVQQRGQLSALIKDELAVMLEPLGISVDDVNVGEIHPPADVTRAIEGLIKARNDLQLLAKQEQTAKEEARKIITDAQRAAEEARLLSQLGEKAIQARRMEIERLRVEKWNGSEVVVGPGPAARSAGE
jgi:regulator of protease activity HflC (stomatin/prohibitin superfamily)